MTGLKISSTLTLPLEGITETFAILARRGSGKSYAASVMAEEMLGAGHPVVVIDPLGVWWGLRSSADGRSAGLPVVIFGGDHADVPLTETSGAIIAEAIVAERIPAIIDLSLLSKSASRRFMTEFVEALYYRNREPLHVFVDEADLFAPQRNLAPEAARLLGAMEDMVRRGRVRGLGCTLITQRPAVLNKDVLSQASVLVAMRLSGKHDVAAIDEWVRLHADEDEAKELKGSLPSLPVGTAWIWSPGWLGILQKVKIRTRTTFDSSATPKVGETRLIPKKMAQIDLTALGEKISAAADEVKANDPKALRMRAARAEKDLATALAKLDKQASVPVRPEVQTVEMVVEKIVEVPVLSADDAKMFADLVAETQAMSGRAAEIANLVAGAAATITAAASAKPAPAKTARAVAQRTQTQPRTAPAPRQAAAPEPSDSDVTLKAGARRILETFARQHPQRLTKAQLGTLAQFKVTGGTFQTYWGQIKRVGFLDERGSGRDADYTLTDAGFAYIGVEPGNPQTTDEILEAYRSVLKAGARAMLDVVVEAYPHEVDRDELAAAVEITASGGTFQTYLGTLRRNGLVTTDAGLIRACDILFPEGHAS